MGTEVDAVAEIQRNPPTEAERQFARDTGRLYPGVFDDEMSQSEIADFWLEVRAAFATAQQ